MARKKSQDRKPKKNLVFDETKRKEFLCGFRKRKLERKKKAKEEMERMLKEEKKRIKQENKEAYKKLVVSSRPLPDITQLLQEEYEDSDVNIKVIEISSDALKKRDLVIGENKPVEKKQFKTKRREDNVRGIEIDNVPGMGSDEEESEGDSEREDATEPLKTKKELKQMLKREATRKIQKSKVFQMKSKLDKVQNKKKASLKKAHMTGKASHKGLKIHHSDSRRVKSKKSKGKWK